MEILTIKDTGDAWLVNSQHSVPKDPANRFYSYVQEAIVAGVVVEPEFTQEEIVSLAEAERLSKTVSMKQARLALLNAGLLPQIDAAIASLTSPDKESVVIQWEYATSLHRSHAWVITLSTAIGLTEQQLDDLFTAAEAIKD